MKHSYLFFLIAFLFSCGGEQEQQVADSKPEPVTEESTLEVEDTEENQDDEALDVTTLPNFKKNLQRKIQQFILSKNVLENQRQKIVIKSVFMNEECTEMKLSYEEKHDNTWMDENGELNQTELTDETNFDILIDLIEATEQQAKVELHITKSYTENGINYYGETFEVNENKDFVESETFQLLTDTKFTDNKISALYYAMRGRKVKREELIGFTLDELSYLRNEFYARKGYVFKTEKMQDYFSKQEWYVPTKRNLTDLLDETELTNVFYIKAMQTELKMMNSEEEKNKVSTIYHKGLERNLTDSDLEPLTAHHLLYLRNEFYARKGHVFKSVRLANYFSSTKWYKPKGTDTEGLLSELEKQNIQFIKSTEQAKR